MRKTVVLNVCVKHPAFDGRVYDKISKTLVKCGYEVHNTSPNAETYLTEDDIYLHGFKQNPGMANRIRSHSGLRNIIEAVHPDCMLCHEPDALFVAYKYYRKEKKRRKVKLYFDCHEAYEHWYDHATKCMILNRLVGNAVMFTINEIVKRIDGVTSVNHTMTERFSKINTNSYFLPSVSKTDNEVNYKSNNNSNLVFMGAFGESKQTEMFIGAAKILKGKGVTDRIAIIGGYRPGDKGEGLFEAQIEKEGLQDFFDFRGWLNREDAFAELKQFGIGIMRFDSYTMSDNFAMPNKLFEYMSNGLALLSCSLNLEIKSIIEKNKCGILIDSETAEALAEAMIYIKAHPEEIEKLKYNSYMAAATEYNWKSYEQLLKHMVEG